MTRQASTKTGRASKDKLKTLRAILDDLERASGHGRLSYASFPGGDEAIEELYVEYPKGKGWLLTIKPDAGR